MKNKLSKFTLLIATTLSLSTVAFEAAAANSLIGGWHETNVAGNNEVIMFLNDGTYFQVQDDGTSSTGMEYGTYSYSEAANQI